ncbi:unnamed protein product [Rhizopus stolonifer]
MMIMVRYKKQYRAFVTDISEATFIEKYLLTAIQRILLKDATEDLLYVILKKNRKKPDFTIDTKVKSKEVYFFVEVKRPGETIKYQPEGDYTKLMKQMKGSVDDQLCPGVKKTYIFWSVD